jgi:hypothetical protein
MFSAETPIHAGLQPSITPLGKARLREDVLHSTYKGKYKKNRQGFKHLQKLQPALEHLLHEGEVIFYAARVQAPANILDQLTWGWYLYFVSGTVLVFTNQRLLHVRIDSGSKWLRIVQSCAWSDVANFKVAGWLSRTVTVTFKDGRSRKYWGVPARDAKLLAKLVPHLLEAHAGSVSAQGTMRPLCPECKGVLQESIYACAGCGLLFKNERLMIKLAFIPGGAYIYCGRWFLALLDIVGESYGVILLLTAMFLVADALLRPAQGAMSVALMTLVIAGMIFGLDVMITIHHCRRLVREFIPTKKRDRVEPAANLTMSASSGA